MVYIKRSSIQVYSFLPARLEMGNKNKERVSETVLVSHLKQCTAHTYWTCLKDAYEVGNSGDQMHNGKARLRP